MFKVMVIVISKNIITSLYLLHIHFARLHHHTSIKMLWVYLRQTKRDKCFMLSPYIISQKYHINLLLIVNMCGIPHRTFQYIILDLNSLLKTALLT